MSDISFNISKGIYKGEKEVVLRRCYGQVGDELIIPEGVTRIATKAFGPYDRIKRIVLPSSVKRISAQAFYETVHLEEIVLNEGLSSIGNDAFYGSGLRSIAFPSSLEAIGSYAFSSCRRLWEVKFSEGLTSIGNDAFSDTAVSSVILPSSLDMIGEYAFSSCRMLESVTLLHLSKSLFDDFFNKYSKVTGNFCGIDHKLYFGKTNPIELSHFLEYRNCYDNTTKFAFKDWFVLYGATVVGYVGHKREVRIPDGAERIAPNVFTDNNTVRSVSLPPSVRYIDDVAFYRCKYLINITLNDGLRRIGDYAFADTLLSCLTIPASVEWVGKKILYNCKCLKSVIVNKRRHQCKWHKEWWMGPSVYASYEDDGTGIDWGYQDALRYLFENNYENE